MNDVPIRPNRQEGELVTYLEFQDLGDKDTCVINVKGGAVVSCDKNYVYVKNEPESRVECVEPFNVFKHVVVKFGETKEGEDAVMCEKPKTIWHKAEEEPEKGSEFVAYCIENGMRKLYFVQYATYEDMFPQDPWSKVRKAWHLKKWAYTDDLFNASVRP